MNPDEAATALDSVGQTEKRLAEHSRWPFYRHAMYGLSQGLLVAAIAQPVNTAGRMIVVAFALSAVCIWDDRRRHGMFVSGWQPGATRPLTIVLTLFVLLMAAASLAARDGASAQALGYLAGLVTFAISTAASMLWQRIYRRQLEGERP